MSSRPRAAAPHIGVFGGTFDPIHLGHLRSAEEARERLRLDQVLFIPAADPPHKRRPVTAAADRLAMVRLAIAGNPHFRVSTIEIRRGGRSYTIDTLLALRRRWRTARLTLLIGRDAFADLASWKSYRELFALADVAVWSRPPHESARDLAALLPVAARGDFCYRPRQDILRHRTGTQIRFLTVTAFDLSASDIRLRARRGASIRYLVPPAVERYIARHGLYSRRRSAS